MILTQLLPYTTEELTTFYLLESVDNWQVQQSTAFKRGFKKYRNDKRVMNSFKILMDHIKQYPRIPPMSEYPVEFNVHHIKRDSRFPGSIWAHLKGQQIGVLFYIVREGQTNTVKLVHLGTHQDLGWS